MGKSTKKRTGRWVTRKARVFLDEHLWATAILLREGGRGDISYICIPVVRWAYEENLKKARTLALAMGGDSEAEFKHNPKRPRC